MADVPFFSIVTPTLNRVAHLKCALESLQAQNTQGFLIEHVIVDGGSTDGTLDLISRIAPHARLIEGVGGGVYYGMNAGIKASSGKVIVLLNDDDELPDDALLAARRAFSRHGDIAGISGLFSISETGRACPTSISDWMPAAERLEDALWTMPGINAIYIKKSVYEGLRYFSLDYSVSSDRDLLIRLFRSPAGEQIVSVPIPLYTYNYHAGSLTMGGSSDAQYHRERERIADRVLRESPPLPTLELERSFRHWHAAQVVALVYQFLKSKRPIAAIGYIVRSLIRRPLWPANYVSYRLQRRRPMD